MNANRRKSLYRPQFDVLESRYAPATLTWQGDTNTNWGTGTNWDLNRAPLDGDILVFPNDPASKICNNNVSGLDLLSISIQDDGYGITGNGITLAAGLTATDDCTFGLDITLTAVKQNILADAGTLTLNGTLDLNGFRVNLGGAGVVQVNGVILGTVGLNKVEGGTVILAGANTYAGVTNVNVGTLVAANSTALGTTTLGTTVAIGATLQLDPSDPLGPEPLTLRGNLALVGSALSQTFAGNMELQGDTIIEVTSNSTLTLSGVLSGTGGFDKLNVGTLRLTGSSPNTYTGNTTVIAGTIELGKASGVSAVGGDMHIGDGNGGLDSDVVRLVAANQIADAEKVFVFSSGLLDLSNQAEILLELQILGGEVRTGTGVLEVTGPLKGMAVSATEQAVLNGKLALSANSVITADNPAQPEGFLINAVIQGTHGLRKQGAGNLFLAAANTYAGTTVVDAGTLLLGHQNGVPLASQLTLATSGTFDLNGFDHRKNGLSGTGTVTNSDSTLNTLFVNPGAGLTSQFDGVLTGNLNLALDGAGRLDLGGDSPNTYAGLTFIIRGLLVLEKPAGVIAIPDSAQTTQDPDLGIGDGNGPNAEAVLNQANPDQIEDGVDVVVNQDGQFISGRNERLDQFTINGQLVSKIQLLEVDEFSVTSSSALIGFVLAGTTPVVSHSQIRSNGGVSLNGKLNLNMLIGGFIPALGDSFKLIDKTSAGAVTGTFVGLAEGARFVDDGLGFQITYVGGDGNDVVVTRVLGPDLYVTAPEKFFDPVVRVFDAVTGEEAYSFLPYLTGYTKGVRVATADVNGDLFPEIICAPGKQDAAFGATVIRVFNGKDGTPLPGALGTGFNPFPGFDGGLFVAAGDFNQDGRADIAVSKNLNTDPTIKVISGANGTTELASLTDVFPNSGTFLKGVRIAVGDVTGDFVPDLIATAGKGSQATVRALDGVNFQPVAGTLGAGFNPFADHAAVNRVLFIAAGDVDADGKADVIVSFKINSNLVRVFDENGVQLKELQGHPDPAYTGGMRVGVTDANNDGQADLVIGTGAAVGLDPAVRLVDFATLADIDAFFAYDQENMGVFVGGTVS